MSVFRFVAAFKISVVCGDINVASCFMMVVPRVLHMAANECNVEDPIRCHVRVITKAVRIDPLVFNVRRFSESFAIR